MNSYTTHKGWGIKKPNQAGLKYKVWPGFRFFCMKKGEVKKTNWIGNWLEKTQNLVHYKHLCSTFTSSSSNVVQTLLVLHMSEVDYSTLKFLAGNRRRSSGRAIALLLKSGMVGSSSTVCVLHAPRMLCQHKKPLPLSLSLSATTTQ